MQVVIPGQLNKVIYDVTAKADASSITSGTVNFYLVCNSGTNTGKWFRASDGTWQGSEAISGTGVYKGGAQWECSIAAAAWEYGVFYYLYAKESGNLNIVYSEQIVPSLSIGVIGSGNIEWTYTLTDSDTELPIADAKIWVTTDEDGENVLYKDTTDESGNVTFYLAAGTYYIWRSKTGYSFTNPDTEVVS